MTFYRVLILIALMLLGVLIFTSVNPMSIALAWLGLGYLAHKKDNGDLD